MAYYAAEVRRVGKVLRIFICRTAGEPMRDVPFVRAIKGVGLEGDRYATERGAFSTSGRPVIRHVTLIAAEDIMMANRLLDVPFTTGETRRNIITTGVQLNGLVGELFVVSGVLMRGVERCDPCTRPSKLTDKEGFDTAFANRGGIRAEILNDGEITVGGHIAVP